MHPENTNFFVGCGANIQVGSKKIHYWKITNDGQTLFARQYSVPGLGLETKCKGVTFDYEKGQGALLITSPVDAFKSVGTYTKETVPYGQDTYIWLIAETGKIIRVQQITFNPSSDLGYLSNVEYGLNSLRTIQ